MQRRTRFLMMKRLFAAAILILPAPIYGLCAAQ